MGHCAIVSKKALLKTVLIHSETATPAISPSQRNKRYVSVSELFGIAACNIEERAAATRGELTTTPLQFINCETIPYGGVLFLLPFLLETGLLSFKSHYRELDAGYYYIDVIVLLTDFMYLCRIKNPEQFKNVNPEILANFWSWSASRKQNVSAKR